MYTINPWLIFALIICATIIAGIAIYFDYRTNNEALKANSANQTDNVSDYWWSKKIIKVHRNYIIGFLGLAIILLLTAKFGGSTEGVFTYLSFASTITSLVLSILAIFVTVHSSSELYKQFNKLEGATDAIESASSQIEDILEAIKVADINLQKTSNMISGQLVTSDEITDKLENMSKEINKRIDQNEKTISDLLNENNSSSPSQDESQVSKKNRLDKQFYIKDTSRFGMYALYLCVLSIEKNKPFKFSQFFTDPITEYYALGYIIPLRSAGFLQFKHINKESIHCEKSYFTKEEIVDGIKKKIEEIRGTDFLKKNLEIFNAINDYYGENHFEIDEKKEK